MRELQVLASGLRATYSKLRSRPDIFPRSPFTWMPLLTVCRSQHKNAEANKKSSPREGLELAVTAGANCGCAQRVSRIFKLDARLMRRCFGYRFVKPNGITAPLVSRTRN